MNNIIVLTKGDNFDFDVSVYDEVYGNLYSGAQEGDILEFKLLKPHQDYFKDTPLIYKYIELTAGEHEKDICLADCLRDHIIDCTFEINHLDTVNLPAGVYYYTIKLKRPGIDLNGNADPSKDQYLTVINKTKFVLND